MATLPPHFFVWLLYMHMSGQATPIAGFKTEAMCVQIRDGMSAKANSTVKFKCDKFVRGDLTADARCHPRPLVRLVWIESRHARWQLE